MPEKNMSAKGGSASGGKLLITGGAGFIGSNFIRYWLNKYPEDFIINLDKLTYAGNLESLKDIEKNPNYEFVQGDICDFELVNDLVDGVDLIVNFAAETHVDRSVMSSKDFIRTNVEGTMVLLDVAKNNGGIRFHHVSTDEVFGDLSLDGAAFTEKSSYNPRNPYSASKAASDHLVRAYYHTHGLPISISNCSNNYGPYHFPEKIIPLFITNLLENKKVPVYGEGKNIRDWIYVMDHVRGIDFIIKKGKIGQTYCLGGNSEITNIELTKKILKLMGKGEEMIEFVKDRPGHDLRYAMDYTKAKNELDWEPQVNLEQGLKQTIDWFKNNQAWWQRVKSGEYREYYPKGMA
ncbi:MAG: dTDP-glucose 4,6-dehydratase [Candidatus Parcubacteria bacterium]|nr:dTDP-glucose 4,6-dehydratase [Candidatus Parcubacteria bacterium]